MQLITLVGESVLPRGSALARSLLEEWLRWYTRARGLEAPMSFYEEQCKLEPHEGVFGGYQSLIMRIGYVVLFAPAFPLGALVCYASFLLQMRHEGSKLLLNTRRPRYAGAQDIGTWQRVLTIFGFVSVFTNLGLIGITSTAFSAALPIRGLGLEINAENKVRGVRARLGRCRVCAHAREAPIREDPSCQKREDPSREDHGKKGHPSRDGATREAVEAAPLRAKAARVTSPTRISPPITPS